MHVDVLLFGAHPDDIEWGIGGTAILLQQQSVSFALIDLTRGEMGSRGTPEERDDEARTAAEFLGGVPRVNLRMPDTEVVDTPAARKQVAEVIREYRPQVVLAPYWKDRHPDHAATGRILRNAALFSILKKQKSAHGPHKPAAVLYYLLHHYTRPSFVVDVSGVYQRKQELLRLHRTQFAMDERATLSEGKIQEKTAEQFGVVSHGLGDYLYALESRDRYFGSLIGVRHGEALLTDKPLKVSDIGRFRALLG